MSKITAKYWGYENDDPTSALEAGWWIEYNAPTLAECWKQIMFDGISSDDYRFDEEE